MAFINNLTNQKQYPLTKKIFLLAFSIRLCFCFFTYFGFTLPGGGNNDIPRLMSYGIDYLENGVENNALDISQSYFYSLIIAFIYKATGSQIFIPLLVNAALGSMAIVFYYKTACLATSIKSAKYIGIILAFTPTYVFFSSMILREVFIHFFLSLHIYLIVLWFKTQKWKHYIAALLSIISACIFHIGIIFFFVGQLVLGANKLLRNKKYFLINFFILIISIYFLIFIFGYFRIGASKMPFLYYENATIIDSVNFILDKQRLKFTDRHWYTLYSDMSLPSDNLELVVCYFPQMVLRTLLNFVFNPRLAFSVTNMIKIPETILFAFLAIISLFSIKKSKYSNYLIIVSWLTVFVYTLGSGEHGQANRHFFKFAAIFLIIAYPLLREIFLRLFPVKKTTYSNKKP